MEPGTAQLNRMAPDDTAEVVSKNLVVVTGRIQREKVGADAAPATRKGDLRYQLERVRAGVEVLNGQAGGAHLGRAVILKLKHYAVALHRVAHLIRCPGRNNEVHTE